MKLVLASILLLSGCLHNDGCELEVHKKWSCQDGGTTTVIVPGSD